MEHQPVCPVCGTQDQSVPVRLLYFAGIKIKDTTPVTNAPIDHVLPEIFKSMPDGERAALTRRLKPPQSNKSPGLHPIHPDLVVLVFSLSIPFFLLRIYAIQPSSFLSVIGLLVALYGLYLWRRKGILRSFKIEETRYKQKKNQNQRALQRWMDLHYCICEDIIFTPKEDLVYPADQMTYYLHIN